MTSNLYPKLRKDTVVDDFHGTAVADPYRWLEETNAEETQAWVNEQNRLTETFIGQYPDRDRIVARLKELQNYPRQFTPLHRGEYYYFWKNDGLQNQPVLYRSRGVDAPPVMVMDPNTLSSDGTLAVVNTAISSDGSLMVYSISRHGSDWQELRVRDLTHDRDYPEIIPWCRYTSVAWDHENRGFFYSRFPDPETVPPEDRTNYNRVYWHQLNTQIDDDLLVHEQPEDKELGFNPIVPEQSDYLFLQVYHGTDTRTRFYYKPLDSDGPVIRLLDSFDAAYDFVDVIGTVCYFKTDLDAPRNRIIAIDLLNPDRSHWREIVGQQEHVIDGVKLINNLLTVVYLKDAHHVMRLYTLEGEFVTEIALPTLGSIVRLTGNRSDRDLFFLFTSFLYPVTVLKVDTSTYALSVHHRPTLPIDPQQFETRQAFFRSTDGTEVPMFLTCRRGLTPRGDTPVLLTGYGGFNVSMTPYFSAFDLFWIESGGIFALANLRGGGEYGDTWHKAGMLERKQTVFDDFISAAEWLIKNNYTNPKRLVITGGSNGGLLVAACLIQRPELYGAVICQVPVLDMLRYHRFSIGYYWISEYGNPDNPEHFPFLYAYSPLHNIQKGTVYPPVFVLTADTDDRVLSSHAKKFVATLQEKTGGANPILLFVETKAGHGMGKPTSKIIDEYGNVYSFIFHLFDIKPGPSR
ncbi:S9 family peptidase [bacterium]|nr:S9 family peptidase [bacterium]